MVEEGRELSAGTRIGDFELLHPIGKGGMGAVWLARVQRKLGFEKLFAIKTILADHSSDTHFQNMFFDEARVASRITHPNVAQIFDLGQEDDLFYIVMEWVDGDSLHRVSRSLMKRQNALLPLGIALRIVADACAGLHAAHELVDDGGLSLEVVHRDVSPQNILVGAQGVTKIIDFGVAKARDRAVETRTGSLKGKLQYMAPEQALGEKVDRRADVFAAGSVLYWLLTGKPPHEGESDIDILRAVANRAPLRVIPDSVPPPVREVLKRMLAVAPADRYPTALDAQQAIERAAAATGFTTSANDVGAFARDVMSEEYERRRRMRANALAKLDLVRSTAPSLSPEQIAANLKLAAAARGSNPDEPQTNVMGQTSLDAGPPSGIIDPDTAANNTLGSAAVDTPVSLPRKRRVAASLGIATGALVGLLTVVVLSAMRGPSTKNTTTEVGSSAPPAPDTTELVPAATTMTPPAPAPIDLDAVDAGQVTRELPKVEKPDARGESRSRPSRAPAAAPNPSPRQPAPAAAAPNKKTPNAVTPGLIKALDSAQ